MLNTILGYILISSIAIGAFVSIILFSRVIIMMFKYIKLEEAISKYRNELAYVKTQISITQRNINKLKQGS